MMRCESALLVILAGASVLESHLGLIVFDSVPRAYRIEVSERLMLSRGDALRRWAGPYAVVARHPVHIDELSLLFASSTAL